MKSMASLHGDSFGAESDSLNMVGKPQRVTWKCRTRTSVSAVRKYSHGGIGGRSEFLNPRTDTCRQDRARQAPGTHRKSVWAPAGALPLPRARRKLGDDLDLLTVAPDAQRQPCARRLPADDVDEIVGAAHLGAGSAHHMIASLQASRLGDAVVHHAIDARSTLALDQLDTEPRPLD